VADMDQNPSSRVSASPQRRARMRNPIEVCFCMSPGGTPLSAGAMTRQAIQRMWKGWLLKPQSAQAEVWIVKKSRKKIISNVRFGIGIQMPSFPNPIRTFYIREIPLAVLDLGPGSAS